MFPNNELDKRGTPPKIRRPERRKEGGSDGHEDTSNGKYLAGATDHRGCDRRRSRRSRLRGDDGHDGHAGHGGDGSGQRVGRRRLPLPYVQQRYHWCHLRPNLRQPEPHLWSGSSLGLTLRSHLVGVRSTGSYAADAGDGLAARHGLHSADAHEPARTPNLWPPNRTGLRGVRIPHIAMSSILREPKRDGPNLSRCLSRPPTYLGGRRLGSTGLHIALWILFS